MPSWWLQEAGVEPPRRTKGLLYQESRRTRGDRVITCETCGNDVETGESICPFCEHPIGHFAANRPKTKTLHTLNIKEDMPTVAEAEQRLRREISALRTQRVHVIKVIHGYGSGGEGGRIRERVHELCRQFLSSRQITDYVFGEDFDRSVRITSSILKRYPELRKDTDIGRRNRGITILALR